MSDEKDKLEGEFKAAIAGTEGKAKEDLASALGYVKLHLVWVAGGVGFVVGVIVGLLVHL